MLIGKQILEKLINKYQDAAVCPKCNEHVWNYTPMCIVCRNYHRKGVAGGIQMEDWIAHHIKHCGLGCNRIFWWKNIGEAWNDYMSSPLMSNDDNLIRKYKEIIKGYELLIKLKENNDNRVRHPIIFWGEEGPSSNPLALDGPEIHLLDILAPSC